jgi:hypothetical protein
MRKFNCPSLQSNIGGYDENKLQTAVFVDVDRKEKPSYFLACFTVQYWWLYYNENKLQTAVFVDERSRPWYKRGMHTKNPQG